MEITLPDLLLNHKLHFIIGQFNSFFSVLTGLTLRTFPEYSPFAFVYCFNYDHFQRSNRLAAILPNKPRQRPTSQMFSTWGRTKSTSPSRWNMIMPALLQWGSFLACHNIGALCFDQSRVLEHQDPKTDQNWKCWLEFWIFLNDWLNILSVSFSLLPKWPMWPMCILITLLRVIPWHLYVLLLANLLAFYLTYLLAFHLAFYLAYLLAF